MNNMNNFNDFMNNIVGKLTEEYNKKSQKRIIVDILMIYNGEYENYENYVTHITWLNYLARQVNDGINAEKPDLRIKFEPYHHIISEDNFNYILKIRREYEERA